MTETDIWNEGRRELIVTMEDGKTETITIKKVPYRLMADYGAAMGDDLKQALLAIEEKKDQKWLEQVSSESFADIMERADEVNDPLFERWWKRAQKKLKFQSKEMEALVSEGVSRFLSEQVSKQSGS